MNDIDDDIILKSIKSLPNMVFQARINLFQLSLGHTTLDQYIVEQSELLAGIEGVVKMVWKEKFDE